jgi:hypothetical protein
MDTTERARREPGIVPLELQALAVGARNPLSYAGPSFPNDGEDLAIPSRMSTASRVPGDARGPG